MAISLEKTGSPKSSSSSASQVSLYSLDAIDSLDPDDIKKINCEFKNLLTNFRLVSKEKDDLKEKVHVLYTRNEFLEFELIQMEQFKSNCSKATHNYGEILKAYDYVRKELEEEREKFKVWTGSGKKVHDLLNDQVLLQTGGLGYNKREKKPIRIEASKNETEPLVKIVKFITTNGKASVSDHENINRTKEEKLLGKNVNIGYLSKSQLKQRLESLSKSGKVKRNMNGKEDINKANNYKNIPEAPKKKCFKCGNQNHLALDCKKVTFKEPEAKTIKIESRTKFS